MDPIEPWVDRDELRRMADALLSAPQATSPEPADATYGADFEGYTGTEPARPPNRDLRPTEPPNVPETTGPPAPDGGPPGSSAEVNARQALAAARAIAQRGGMLVEPAAEPPDTTPSAGPAPTAAAPAQLTQVSPVPGPPPETPPAAVNTPFLARLKAYGTWLQDGIQAKAFFVLDREGSVLIDEVHSPKLHQVARTLAQASHMANRQAGAAAIGNIPVKIAPENTLEVVPVLTRYGPLILGVILDHPLSSRNVESVARGLQQVIDGAPGATAP